MDFLFSHSQVVGEEAKQEGEVEAPKEELDPQKLATIQREKERERMRKLRELDDGDADDVTGLYDYETEIKDKLCTICGVRKIEKKCLVPNCAAIYCCMSDFEKMHRGSKRKNHESVEIKENIERLEDHF